MINFYTKIKEQKLSFTLATIFAIVTCANEIEAFRYRFKDGEVVKYNTPNLSFTYLNKETELMKNVVAEMRDNIHDVVTYAYEVANNQKEYFTGPMGNDIYQFLSIPWISYTHISHTDSGKKIMQHLYLIGEKSFGVKERCLCHFLFRPITLL